MLFFFTGWVSPDGFREALFLREVPHAHPAALFETPLLPVLLDVLGEVHAAGVGVRLGVDVGVPLGLIVHMHRVVEVGLQLGLQLLRNRALLVHLGQAEVLPLPQRLSGVELPGLGELGELAQRLLRVIDVRVEGSGRSFQPVPNVLLHDGRGVGHQPPLLQAHPALLHPEPPLLGGVVLVAQHIRHGADEAHPAGGGGPLRPGALAGARPPRLAVPPGGVAVLLLLRAQHHGVLPVQHERTLEVEPPVVCGVAGHPDEDQLGDAVLLRPVVPRHAGHPLHPGVAVVPRRARGLLAREPRAAEHADLLLEHQHVPEVQQVVPLGLHEELGLAQSEPSVA
mmetsp:Transcript_31023/g.86908  ORF Transcript_31023/g.86908 Transcript_31023/m.86908 type:complete len:339 (+) Transcript_31023:2584-3600(+)